MVATIRLYGTDATVTGITPTKATLDALGDIIYYEFQALRIDAGVSWEGEVRKFINGFQVSVNRNRGTYDLRPAPISYPTEQVTFEVLFPFAVVTLKKHLFLWLNDYPITCYPDPTTKAIRVYVAGETELEHGDGNKQVEINLAECSQNRERD